MIAAFQLFPATLSRKPPRPRQYQDYELPQHAKHTKHNRKPLLRIHTRPLITTLHPPSIGEGADSSLTLVSMCLKGLSSVSCLKTSQTSTFKNRHSPRGDASLRHTGALGPQHPLIRDWYHKKRTSAVTVPSLLNRYKLSLSDSSLATHSKTVKDSFTTPRAERISDASGSQSYKPPNEDKGYKKRGRLYDSTHSGSSVERKSKDAREKQGFSETSSGSTTTLPSIDRAGFTVGSAATHAREDSSMESNGRETEEIFGDFSDLKINKAAQMEWKRRERVLENQDQ